MFMIAAPGGSGLEYVCDSHKRVLGDLPLAIAVTVSTVVLI